MPEDDRPGEPSVPSYIRGKHWHPSLGWTNHSEAACRQTIHDSEPLNDLRDILARRRAKQSKT